MDSEMPKVSDCEDVSDAREVIKTILDAMYKIGQDNISARVDVAPELLEMAVSEIDEWRELASEFSACIVITQGEIKPRITVDIEKFLETQHNYQIKTNGL